jgi:hypothetical protein
MTAIFRWISPYAWNFVNTSLIIIPAGQYTPINTISRTCARRSITTCLLGLLRHKISGLPTRHKISISINILLIARFGRTAWRHLNYCLVADWYVSYYFDFEDIGYFEEGHKILRFSFYQPLLHSLMIASHGQSVYYYISAFTRPPSHLNYFIFVMDFEGLFYIAYSGERRNTTLSIFRAIVIRSSLI